jgi:hypothetical protein
MKLLTPENEKRFMEIVNEVVDLDIYTVDFGEWLDELESVTVVEVKVFDDGSGFSCLCNNQGFCQAKWAMEGENTKCDEYEKAPTDCPLPILIRRKA